MSETPQVQITNQPMRFVTQGLPGAPAIEVDLVASQTGDVLKILDSTGAKVWGVDVSGAQTSRASVISGQGATRTLLASESGATCYFDRAAGIIYTLPAPVVGLHYDFVSTVTVTSNAYTVITDAGTTFVEGLLINVKSDGTLLGCLGNGTSHVKVQSNGGTTGGVLGGWFRVRCVSATVWTVTGMISGTSTIATPFA